MQFGVKVCTKTVSKVFYVNLYEGVSFVLLQNLCPGAANTGQHEQVCVAKFFCTKRPSARLCGVDDKRSMP